MIIELKVGKNKTTGKVKTAEFAVAEITIGKLVKKCLLPMEVVRQGFKNYREVFPEGIDEDKVIQVG